jgi:hypothetical protein
MPEQQLDHDLLIQINTKLERVITDVKELKDNVADRVSALEMEKFNKADANQAISDGNKIHDDHEKRLRYLETTRVPRLENWRWYILGITVTAIFVSELLLQFYFHNPH